MAGWTNIILSLFIAPWRVLAKYVHRDKGWEQFEELYLSGFHFLHKLLYQVGRVLFKIDLLIKRCTISQFNGGQF